MQKDHLEIILEGMNSKLDLLLEGHQVLQQQITDLGRRTDERFDLVDFKIGALNQKIDDVEQRLNDKIDTVEQNLSNRIDAVAADLKSHRADTEAHHPLTLLK